MARGRVKSVEVSPEVTEAVLAFAQGKMIELADTVGHKIEDVARQRAPVSGKTQEQRAVLRSEHEFPGGRRGSEQEKLRQQYEKFAITRAGQIAQLKAAGGKSSSKALLQFFRGTRKGGTLKQSPVSIRLKGNTIVGTFKTGGHLRDSIHYRGASVVEGSVIVEVVAEADYAAAVHEGFTHRGGRKHQGAATKIPPNPFLRSALEINGRATITGG